MLILNVVVRNIILFSCFLGIGLVSSLAGASGINGKPTSVYGCLDALNELLLPLMINEVDERGYIPYWSVSEKGGSMEELRGSVQGIERYIDLNHWGTLPPPIAPVQKLYRQGITVTALNQTWLRYAQYNPGTELLGERVSQGVDLGLRRTRFQVIGNLSERVFVYFQLGQNNFNAATAVGGNRKQSFFIHDAVSEYRFTSGGKGRWGSKIIGEHHIGGGLTIMNGLSRFSQPSIGTIMTLDVPVFAQATVDQTDLFSRKLSVYYRGALNKWDYRLVFTDPFPINSAGISIPAISKHATFSPYGHRKQYQGLVMYQFFEKESMQTPYMTGTYLGKKKVLNISAGVIVQQRATWNYQDGFNGVGRDTVFNAMRLWSADAFLDMPLFFKPSPSDISAGEKPDCLSAYLGYFNTNYGKDYLRFNGLMNPATSMGAVGGKTAVMDAGGQYGNALPMFGTGRVVYAQLGYLFGRKLNNERATVAVRSNDYRKSVGLDQWQLFGSFTGANYDRLYRKIATYVLGVNLIHGPSAKWSLCVENRPSVQVFGDDSQRYSRKNAVILQYQVFFSN